MDDEKQFIVRIPKELHFFLKKEALLRDTSMNALAISLFERYKKKIEKRVDSK